MSNEVLMFALFVVAVLFAIYLWTKRGVGGGASISMPGVKAEVKQDKKSDPVMANIEGDDNEQNVPNSSSAQMTDIKGNRNKQNIR